MHDRSDSILQLDKEDQDESLIIVAPGSCLVLYTGDRTLSWSVDTNLIRSSGDVSLCGRGQVQRLVTKPLLGLYLVLRAADRKDHRNW